MMDNISKTDKLPILACYHRYITNYFCKHNSRTWIKCRETFHNDCDPGRSNFYFGSNKVQSIAKMFDWVENVLNIDKKKRTIIHRCLLVDPYNRATLSKVLFIELSPFWKSNKARYQFSTILARVGRGVSDKRSPLVALKRSRYCYKTARAVALFLGGRTDLSNISFRGWVLKFDSPFHALCLKRPKNKSFFQNKKSKSNLNKSEKETLVKWVNASERDVHYQLKPPFQFK